MSSAKSLPALPTPILERGCESRTNCSWFMLFLQGGILHRTTEYFYIPNFSLAFFSSSVQAAEIIPSTLSNGSLTTRFDEILMTLPWLLAASPHFRHKSLGSFIIVTIIRRTLTVVTRTIRLCYTGRRRDKERNPDAQKFYERQFLGFTRFYLP